MTISTSKVEHSFEATKKTTQTNSTHRKTRKTLIYI